MQLYTNYLGVTMDRSMIYNPHLSKQRLKSRTNIIQKLVGSSWDCSASTLRTSAMALVYSTTEYFCPVWSHSTHDKKIDRAINSCLRLFTRPIKSTSVDWLPVLANIIPSNFRRNGELAREARKIYGNGTLPIHQDLGSRTGVGLILWMKIQEIDYNNYDMQDQWRNHWCEQSLINSKMVLDPTEKNPRT